MSTIDTNDQKLYELYPDIEKLTLYVAFEKADAEAEPNYQQIIFSSDSAAEFHLECSREGCAQGGFDFASNIQALVRSGELRAQGKIVCPGMLRRDEKQTCCSLQSEYRIVIQRKPLS